MASNTVVLNGNGRSANGKFAVGNPGGPGRPRRAVEREYLAALSDAIPLEDWRQIVMRAVEDAKAGDPRAREWIAGYVLGSTPITLRELAKLEELGIEPKHEVAALADQTRHPSEIEEALECLGNEPLERRALRFAVVDKR